MQYLNALGLALFRREVPVVHIILSPCVPYLKYVGPPAAAWAMFHALGLDAMVIRVLANEDAKLRARQLQQQIHANPPVTQHKVMDSGIKTVGL